MSTEPFFSVAQYLSYVGASITLFHASIHGKQSLGFWLVALVSTIWTQFVSPSVDSQHSRFHANGQLMLFSSRVPLYFPLAISSLIYCSFMSMARLRLKPVAEAISVAMVSLLLYIPFDVIGSKLLWWSWRNSFLLSHKHISAPYTDYLEHFLFVHGLMLAYVLLCQSSNFSMNLIGAGITTFLSPLFLWAQLHAFLRFPAKFYAIPPHLCLYSTVIFAGALLYLVERHRLHQTAMFESYREKEDSSSLQRSVSADSFQSEDNNEPATPSETLSRHGLRKRGGDSQSTSNLSSAVDRPRPNPQSSGIVFRVSTPLAQQVTWRFAPSSFYKDLVFGVVVSYLIFLWIVAALSDPASVRSTAYHQPFTMNDLSTAAQQELYAIPDSHALVNRESDYEPTNHFVWEDHHIRCNMPDQIPQPGANYYTICGTPHPSFSEFYCQVAALLLVAFLVFHHFSRVAAKKWMPDGFEKKFDTELTEQEPQQSTNPRPTQPAASNRGAILPPQSPFPGASPYPSVSPYPSPAPSPLPGAYLPPSRGASGSRLTSGVDDGSNETVPHPAPLMVSNSSLGRPPSPGALSTRSVPAYAPRISNGTVDPTFGGQPPMPLNPVQRTPSGHNLRAPSPSQLSTASMPAGIFQGNNLSVPSQNNARNANASPNFVVTNNPTFRVSPAPEHTSATATVEPREVNAQLLSPPSRSVPRAVPNPVPVHQRSRSGTNLAVPGTSPTTAPEISSPTPTSPLPSSLVDAMTANINNNVLQYARGGPPPVSSAIRTGAAAHASLAASALRISSTNAVVASPSLDALSWPEAGSGSGDASPLDDSPVISPADQQISPVALSRSALSQSGPSAQSPAVAARPSYTVPSAAARTAPSPSARTSPTLSTTSASSASNTLNAPRAPAAPLTRSPGGLSAQASSLTPSQRPSNNLSVVAPRSLPSSTSASPVPNSPGISPGGFGSLSAISRPTSTSPVSPIPAAAPMSLSGARGPSPSSTSGSRPTGPYSGTLGAPGGPRPPINRMPSERSDSPPVLTGAAVTMPTTPSLAAATGRTPTSSPYGVPSRPPPPTSLGASPAQPRLPTPNNTTTMSSRPFPPTGSPSPAGGASVSYSMPPRSGSQPQQPYGGGSGPV